MTHYKTLVDSEWLGQWDMPEGRDVVVIIDTVQAYKPARKQRKKMPDGTYKDEPCKRIDIGLRGPNGRAIRKHWLSGPVSHKALVAMYGTNVDDWKGRPIALYVDHKVEFGGVITGGLRVRPTPPRGPATDDALDRPVDEERAAMIEEAKNART